MNRAFNKSLWVVLAATLFCLPALAQTGSISGSVTDSNARIMHARTVGRIIDRIELLLSRRGGGRHGGPDRRAGCGTMLYR